MYHLGSNQNIQQYQVNNVTHLQWHKCIIYNDKKYFRWN